MTIDTVRLSGSIDLVDAQGDPGDRTIADRQTRRDLAPDPGLPADTRLWATLQNASGGTWGGCVYDPDAIARAIG